MKKHLKQLISCALAATIESSASTHVTIGMAERHYFLKDTTGTSIGGSYRRDIYVEILIHENLKLRLLEYCKKNISSVTRLYPRLLPECKADSDSIFLKYIMLEAENASNRSQYRAVCDIIKHYKKACGSKNAAGIQNEMLVKYPRRPAFADELKKLKLLY